MKNIPPPQSSSPDFEKTQHPRLSAHRGLSIACPENTLPAFAAAAALGVHEIELDLRPSRDGVPVVCHDETVDRTTTSSGKICDLDWNVLRNLDAGSKTGELWKGTRIPCFEDILDWVPPLLGMNVHIKDGGKEGALIKEVCKIFHEQDLLSLSYLALDTEENLRCAKKFAPEITLACLARQDTPDESIRIALETGCQRIQFGRNVTREQIHVAKEQGLICNLFYSDDPLEGKSYCGMGIDVVLTNKANLMIAGGFQPLSKG